MCQRVTCSRCKRPGYVGCGAHVEQVLQGVPAEERCRCREERAERRRAEGGAGAGSGSWLRRLLGKE